MGVGNFSGNLATSWVMVKSGRGLGVVLGSGYNFTGVCGSYCSMVMVVIFLQVFI